MSDGKLRVLPLGGVGEIGKNMTVVEYDGRMVIVDCGLRFPTAEMMGIDLVLPDFSYVRDNIDALEAIVITHGHEDHLGALPWMIRDLGQDKIPVVYSGQLTIAMARSKLDEHKLRDVRARGAADRRHRGRRAVRDRAHPPHALDPRLQRRRAQDRRSAPSSSPATTSSTRRRSAARPRTWRAWPSSAATACCCCAATRRTSTAPGVSDSRVDRRPAPGPRVRPLQGPHRRHLLRVEHPPRPAGRRTRPRRTAARSRWSAARCARTSTSAVSLGHIDIPEGMLLPPREIDQWADEKIVVISTGSQGEPLSALRRMAYRDHPQVELSRGDTVVFSATPIPGNERAVNETIDRLYHIGCEVVTARDAPIHASGHGYAEEVKMMINLTRPKYVMPVHGDFKRMLIHGQLAQAVGVPASNIFRTENGTPLEIDAEGARLGKPVQAGMIFVDGVDIGDVVRRRAARPPHALARTASSSSSRRSPSRTARPSSPPEVLARGVPFLEGNSAFIDELREAVEDSLDRAAEQQITEIDVLESLPARRPRDVHLRPAQAPPDGACRSSSRSDAPGRRIAATHRPAPGFPRPRRRRRCAGSRGRRSSPPSRKPTPGHRRRRATPAGPTIRAWYSRRRRLLQRGHHRDPLDAVAGAAEHREHARHQRACRACDMPR